MGELIRDEVLLDSADCRWPSLVFKSLRVSPVNASLLEREFCLLKLFNDDFLDMFSGFLWGWGCLMLALSSANASTPPISAVDGWAEIVNLLDRSPLLESLNETDWDDLTLWSVHGGEVGGGGAVAVAEPGGAAVAGDGRSSPLDVSEVIL